VFPAGGRQASVKEFIMATALTPCWGTIVAGVLGCVLWGGESPAAAEKQAPVTGTGVLVTQNESGETVTLADKEHLVVALAFRV
jgi:hypothetical protein